jgi:hypothetical protein
MNSIRPLLCLALSFLLPQAAFVFPQVNLAHAASISASEAVQIAQSEEKKPKPKPKDNEAETELDEDDC